MNIYLKYMDNIDFSSQIHVKDIKKLFVNDDLCVALYSRGEFYGFFDLPDFYQLKFNDSFNDFCLGIYVSYSGTVNFIVNFDGLGVDND